MEAETIGLQVVNERVKEGEPKAYFDFVSEKGSLDYNITTLGHPIGLTRQYPASSLQKYHIKLRKGRDSVMKSKSPTLPLRT